MNFHNRVSDSIRLFAGRRRVQTSNAYRLPHCISQHQERADKSILSVESGGPADVALMASALVRWLCVTGFSRVCPSIFLSIGSVWNRRIYLSKSIWCPLVCLALRNVIFQGRLHGLVVHAIEYAGWTRGLESQTRIHRNRKQ